MADGPLIDLTGKMITYTVRAEQVTTACNIGFRICIRDSTHKYYYVGQTITPAQYNTNLTFTSPPISSSVTSGWVISSIGAPDITKITSIGIEIDTLTFENDLIIKGIKVDMPKGHYLTFDGDLVDRGDDTEFLTYSYTPSGSGIPAASDAYMGAVYSPAQNKIYLAPYTQSNQTYWHYINCTQGGGIGSYTHPSVVALGYNGAVYSPTQDRVYFVPYAQANQSNWHYLNCSTGTVTAYTAPSSMYYGAYGGGAYSTILNRIYFSPLSQANVTNWHYIDCNDGTVHTYTGAVIGGGSSSGNLRVLAIGAGTAGLDGGGTTISPPPSYGGDGGYGGQYSENMSVAVTQAYGVYTVTINSSTSTFGGLVTAAGGGGAVGGTGGSPNGNHSGDPGSAGYLSNITGSNVGYAGGGGGGGCGGEQPPGGGGYWEAGWGGAGAYGGADGTNGSGGGNTGYPYYDTYYGAGGRGGDGAPPYVILSYPTGTLTTIVTGSVSTTVGVNTIHTFTGSGTFTIQNTINAYQGAVYVDALGYNSVFFIPYGQATQPTWHYINSIGVIGSYLSGYVIDNQAFWEGVYSPNQKRIYLVPYSISNQPYWYYIDCSNIAGPTVVRYATGLTIPAQQYAYQGGVYSPLQDRIYFSPNTQATQTYWHYIDCKTGNVVSYTHTVSPVSFAYNGGAYSPKQNRIFFSPQRQAPQSSWHYIQENFWVMNSVGTIGYSSGVHSSSLLLGVGLNYIYSSGNTMPTSGTVMMWLNSSSYPTSLEYPNPFTTHYLGGDNSIRIELHSNGHMYLYCSSGGGNLQATDFFPIIPLFVANKWYHVAFSYDKNANIIKAYTNGALTGSLSVTPGNWPTSTYWQPAFGTGFTSTLDRNWNGKLDDVMVYNSVLTETQIYELYNSNTLHAYTLPTYTYDWFFLNSPYIPPNVYSFLSIKAAHVNELRYALELWYQSLGSNIGWTNSAEGLGVAPELGTDIREAHINELRVAVNKIRQHGQSCQCHVVGSCGSNNSCCNCHGWGMGFCCSCNGQWSYCYGGQSTWIPSTSLGDFEFANEVGCGSNIASINQPQRIGVDDNIQSKHIEELRASVARLTSQLNAGTKIEGTPTCAGQSSLPVGCSTQSSRLLDGVTLSF